MASRWAERLGIDPTAEKHTLAQYATCTDCKRLGYACGFEGDPDPAGTVSALRGERVALPEQDDPTPDEAPAPSEEELRRSDAIDFAREYSGNFDFMRKMRQAVLDDRPFSVKMIDAILRIKAQDEERARLRSQEAALPEIEDGFYELTIQVQDDAPGERSEVVLIIKVKHAIHTSGRQYATFLDIDSGRWEYQRGLITDVRKNGKKLTLARAKELGHVYGRCMICGATLTDERSIERGIGPICAGKL